MELVSTNSLAVEQLTTFQMIVGEEYVFVDDEVLYNYSHDETEDLHYLPDVVIKPGSAEEISAILKFVIITKFR
jgi:glycolate oxidase